jgi:hypothetical protein
MSDHYEVIITEDNILKAIFLVKKSNVTSENINISEAKIVHNELNNEEVDPLKVEEILSLLNI